MTKRQLLVALSLCGFALTACGIRSGENTAGDGPLTIKAPPPLAAALVNNNFGWVLTEDQLLIRTGAGLLTSVSTPVGPGPVRTAYFADARHGFVAGRATDGSLTVAETADGGETWNSSTVRDPLARTPEYSAITMAFGDAAHGAILATIATGPVFSHATLFTTIDGGRTWKARPAPEAGQLSVDTSGRIWVARTMLNLTDDQGNSWTRATVSLTEPAAAVTMSTPVHSTMAATTTNSGSTHVELFTTPNNGATWVSSRRISVQARTGPGVRLPIAETKTGLLVFDTTGGHAYHGSTGTDIHPSGLLDGVHSLSFTPDGTNGWALTTRGSCAHAKENCALHDDLLTTTDAGTTWHPLAEWITPLS